MKRAVARELMDDPVDSLDELEANLTDIERVNARFGGITPVLREVRRSGARTILDIGTGSGDIPLAIVHDAQRRRRPIVVTCLDRSEQMLAIARRRSADHAALSFVHGDGTALPYDDRAFDMVTCSLALHHFEPDAAELLLREMRRVARMTPLVCDLRRTRTAFVATWLYARLFSRNRLTRHDAPLSVRRAYTGVEARALAQRAGWAAPYARRESWFRMTLIDRSA